MITVTLAAIVLIEILILVPAALRERERFDRIFAGRAAESAWSFLPKIRPALQGEGSLTTAGLDDMQASAAPYSIVIWDQEGEVLFAPKAVLGKVEGLDPAEWKLGEVRRFGGKKIRAAILPLQEADEKAIGYLGIIDPKEGMSPELLHFVLRVLGLVLIICLGTACAVLVITYYDVLAPIQRLIAANVATWGREPDEDKIPEEDIPHSEIGEIMRTRNRMLGRLADIRDELLAKKEELELLYRTLEERVAKRTKQLQTAREQVLHSEKLAAIGKLAASVAHEINNPLGIIAAGTEELRRLIDSRAENEALVRESRNSLEAIRSQIRRCKEIIDSLLAFARPGDPESVQAEAEDIPVVAFFEQTVGLLARQARSQELFIQLHFDAVPATMNVLKTNLQQAVVNLIQNALDASSPGGEVRVRVRGENDALEISICDDGAGMSEEMLDRVFDPFFTTKEPGRGSGMGLTIADHYIRAIGGHLSCESKQGEGAVFRITLPGRI